MLCRGVAPLTSAELLLVCAAGGAASRSVQQRGAAGGSRVLGRSHEAPPEAQP